MRLLSPRGTIGPATYLFAALALIGAQPAGVALALVVQGSPFVPDAEFWLLPLRRFATLPNLPAWAAALAFAVSLALSWALAVLSFRRAAWAGRGFSLAALSVVPVVQLPAVAVLALLPPERTAEPPEAEPGLDVLHVIQGVGAGVALIVFAVLVSAVGFGAYGWGLFVLTPFLVGVTTAYIANRRVPLEYGRTSWLVLGASMLGSLALLMFALEGFMCILLIAPLAAVMALAGGALGRAAASAGHRRGRPYLSVALLPAVFALEGAMPPALPILTRASVEVAAPPAAVWAALVSDAAVAEPPGPVGWAGLAYPRRGRLLRQGVGAVRLGEFSTGVAREEVTRWHPGRELAFAVRVQPPAMEEMSPYRRVRAPHVHGYFDTGETRFRLSPIADGGTRLTMEATHVLRLDPVLYWAPIARWAIRGNADRVLRDLQAKAER